MAYIKLTFIGLLIGNYFFLTLPFLITFAISPNKTRKVLNRIVSFYSKMMLKLLGMKVSTNIQDRNYTHNLIVSNHLSYTDILVLSSIVPCAFVTSVEMKNTPLLGQITRLAGCLFVERRNKANIKNEIKEIEEALHDGLNVIVFPEATSTNGEQVIPFKRSLFQASVNAGKHTVPVTINYKTINNEAVSLSNRDLICWYGDMDFFPHLWDLCQQKSIEVDVRFDEKIAAEDCSIKLRDSAFATIALNYISIK